MHDRMHWELYRQRTAELDRRAARDWYLGRKRRRSTRLPQRARESD